MDFSTLKGKEFLFYGVDNLRFKLDETVYEVREDEEDGYRSSMEGVWVLSTIEELAKFQGVFAKAPYSIVKVEKDDGTRSGYILSDVEFEHEWLSFGTDYSEDYYPIFYFNYSPMDPKLRKRPEKPSRPAVSSYIDPLDWLFEQRDV